MKILCVSSAYWPAFQFGGPINSVHGLNKVLVKKGIDVTVYTTNVGLDEKVCVNEEYDIDGVKVIYFPFVKVFEFMGQTGWHFSWKMSKAIKENINKFDLIFIPGIWNYPVAMAGYYCRKYKKPYIIAPKGCLYPYTFGKKKWKKWLYYNLISKRDIEYASLIYYATNDECKKVHTFLKLKNKAVVVPNGIDLSDFNNLFDRKKLNINNHQFLKNKKIILFLSRINWKKGLDILSQAYSKLAKERDDVHMFIVGPDEGSYIEKVKKWLMDGGVLEKVTFTGMLTGKEKLKAFMVSDVFVLPSYSENFGIAIVEAMACNLPVIISDQVGIYKKIENAKAGIIIPTESKSLYNALVRLLENRKESLEMGKCGRKLVEKYFDINEVADKTIKVFEDVVNEKL